MDEIMNFFDNLEKFEEELSKTKQEIKSAKWEIHKLDKKMEKRARDISKSKKIKMSDPNFEEVLLDDVEYSDYLDSTEMYNHLIRDYQQDIMHLQHKQSIYFDTVREKNLFAVNYGELKEKVPFDSEIYYEIDSQNALDALWKYSSDTISKDDCLSEFTENGLVKYKVDKKSKPIYLKLGKLNEEILNYIDVINGKFNFIPKKKADLEVVFDPEMICKIQKMAYSKNKDGEIEVGSPRYRALLNAICYCLYFDYEKYFCIEIPEKAEEQE